MEPGGFGVMPPGNRWPAAVRHGLNDGILAAFSFYAPGKKCYSGKICYQQALSIVCDPTRGRTIALDIHRCMLAGPCGVKNRFRR